MATGWSQRDGPTLETWFLAALGAGLGVGVMLAVVALRGVLLLVALAVVLALGLDAGVRPLVRRGLCRPVSVAIVLGGTLLALAGVLAVLIPPVVAQASALVHHLPTYLTDLRQRSGTLGRLERRFHLQTFAQHLVSAHGGAAVHGLVGAGRAALSVLAGTLLVAALTGYLLADLPSLSRYLLRAVPAPRRAQVAPLAAETAQRVGGYVLGNLLTSLVAGVGTAVWLLLLRVPDPLALSVLVAVLDLVPVVGSTVAGAVVSLVALTVSVPIAAATLGFYVVYRLLEDYLLVPRVMARTVSVRPLATIVALLLGGTLFGIIGALLAVPAAATVALLMRDVITPRLDAL